MKSKKDQTNIKESKLDSHKKESESNSIEIDFEFFKKNIGWLFLFLGISLIVTTRVYLIAQNNKILKLQEISKLNEISYNAQSDQLVETNEQDEITEEVDPNFEKANTSNPIQIEIPKAGINLPIEETAIIDGVWQVSNSIINHLSISADPGGNNNIVVYGHNHSSIFGNIRNLSIGDYIAVLTDDKVTHNYVVEEIHVVKPEEIEFLLPKDSETLTLYTCTGFLDSERFVIIAKPI